ncbi:hypothetical protein AYL99_11291 [Fonsecaea erecta]|uniref:protein-ribulosamine 3-kinase n=1 Tax=Fonsecaea erecta TaxID=1367422 RepID=A0A178Z6N3_9EURO|nr:hypothetical protein AYL99_11291 [Fonsecaea erecta]OAP54843.1 hypothetical protein AYL99_11291 [Fonsecaea erecta]
MLSEKILASTELFNFKGALRQQFQPQALSNPNLALADSDSADISSYTPQEGESRVDGTADGSSLVKIIKRMLPLGSVVKQEVISLGTGTWTRASRIDVTLLCGETKSYFLKRATESQGKDMMHAEYRSMMEISSHMPELVPRPIAWDKFKQSSPETYFFIMDFVDLARKWSSLRTSVASSPSFIKPNIAWESNWCVYFTRLLTQFYDREIAQNGSQPEYQDAYQKLVSDVVPQLLEPLQADGRVLKPCLTHGDLWEENAGLNLATCLPVVFDASVMYAHNEMELGMWRADPIRFGEPFYSQYLEHMPPSEPSEQFDDRNRLYSIKFKIAHCLGWPDSAPSHRQLILSDMRYLIDKYSPQQ